MVLEWSGLLPPQVVLRHPLVIQADNLFELLIILKTLLLLGFSNISPDKYLLCNIRNLDRVALDINEILIYIER